MHNYMWVLEEMFAKLPMQDEKRSGQVTTDHPDDPGVKDRVRPVRYNRHVTGVAFVLPWLRHFQRTLVCPSDDKHGNTYRTMRQRLGTDISLREHSSHCKSSLNRDVDSEGSSSGQVDQFNTSL